MHSVIGEGNNKSVQELMDIIGKYVQHFGEDVEIIKVDFLKEEKAQNKDLIALYERAIKENKLVFEYISYDYDYLDGVDY